MPIELVYRGSSSGAAGIPGGMVIWDGEKYVTYDGEELTLGEPCGCDTTELEEQVNLLVESTTEIDSDLTAVERRTSTLEGTVAAQDARVASLDTKVQGLDENVSNCLVEVQNIDSRVTKTQAQINSLLATDASMDERIVNLTNEQSNLNTRVDAAETAVNGIQTNVNAQNTKINQLSADVTNCNTKVEAFGTEVAKIAACEDKVDDLAADVAAIDADVTAIDADLTEIEGNVADIDTRLAAVENEVEPFDGTPVTYTFNVSALNGYDELTLSPQLELVKGRYYNCKIEASGSFTNGTDTLQAIGTREMVAQANKDAINGTLRVSPAIDVFVSQADVTKGYTLSHFSNSVAVFLGSDVYEGGYTGSGTVTVTLTPLETLEGVTLDEDKIVLIDSVNHNNGTYSIRVKDGALSIMNNLTYAETVITGEVADTSALESEIDALETRVTTVEGYDSRIADNEDDIDSLETRVTTVEKYEARIAALEAIGIAEEGVY